MDGITVKAPAKINLFLEVGERMADGYHKIDSVMQSVTLYDTLTVQKADGGITFDCSDKNLVYDGNLVIKAVKLFFSESGTDGGANVYLDKKIPVKAGLGGGSSDAAATLEALNKLYGFPLSEEKLLIIGKRLGADVPFCIKRGLCRAFGIGEVLHELPPLPSCFTVIAKGDTSVSTRAAFELIDRQKNRQIKSSSNMAGFISKGDLNGICAGLYNVFESNGDYDGKIKRIMYKHNANGALMSGSGPSVFGIFDNVKNAENAENELKSLGYECFLCLPEINP